MLLVVHPQIHTHTHTLFRTLFGNHQYKRWPDHRQSGWQPKSAFDLKVREEFFLFFEVGGPLAFTYHLLRHGIVFGDLSAVSPTLPLGQMVTTFLRGAGQPQAATHTDPLGLFSETAGVGACAGGGREEAEALELTDQRLEAELRGPPQEHPGYFTTAGMQAAAAQQVAVDRGGCAEGGECCGCGGRLGCDGRTGRVHGGRRDGRRRCW